MLNIKFITVHKAKGLEADNVIVLNLKNHLFGFPNKMRYDHIVPVVVMMKNTDLLKNEDCFMWH